MHCESLLLLLDRPQNDLFPHKLEAHAVGVEEIGHGIAFIPQQAQEQVLRPDVVVEQPIRFLCRVLKTDFVVFGERDLDVHRQW